MDKIISITKGDLKINLNVDFLNYSKEKILKSSDLENVFLNGKQVNINDLEKEIDRLYNIALSIMKNNNLSIFDYLPLTKKNLFHKSKNILLASSKIQNIFNCDYFHSDTLSLQLVPISYVDKINPFKCTSPESFPFMDSFSGDGKQVNMELGWFTTKDEKPIINDNGEFVKVIPKKKNTYLKPEEIKIGHVYKDAKDNEFLYIGHIIMSVIDDGHYTGDGSKPITYSSLDEYYKSKFYKKFLNYVSSKDVFPYFKRYEYIKLSKKIKEQLETVKDLNDIFEFYQKEYQKNGGVVSFFRSRETPMKFVSEEYKMVEDYFKEKLYFSERFEEQIYCIDYRDLVKKIKK